MAVDASPLPSDSTLRRSSATSGPSTYSCTSFDTITSVLYTTGVEVQLLCYADM